MDEIDQAQYILEGKCPECFCINNEHRTTCTRNPLHKHLKQLEDVLTWLAELESIGVDSIDDEHTLEFIEQYIQEKIKGKKDV